MIEYESDYSTSGSDETMKSPALSTQVSKISTDEGYTYEVLPVDKLVDKMETTITEIVGMINPPIPNSTAMALLNHFRWDRTRFLDKYFEDEDKLFREASVSKPKTLGEKDEANRLKKVNSLEEILCKICFNSQPKYHNTGLEECGHVYCNQCWRGYLNSKVP